VVAAVGRGAPATILLDGVYNFSDRSFGVAGADQLSLVGTGPQSTQLVFRGAPFAGFTHPGVNFSSSRQSVLRGASIDYIPKPPGTMCDFRASRDPHCGMSGPGITLGFYNCSQMLAEDVTIHAAPYMGVTSLNGDGGHVLRRLRFEKNVPGQVFVAERDGLHESDVRVGLLLEDSDVGGLGDDFFNAHNTLLVVLRCEAGLSTCIVINPHVGGGSVWPGCAGPGSIMCPLSSGV
jgi:hypothetical protein